MAVLCSISCLIKHFNKAYTSRAPLTTDTAHGTEAKEQKYLIKSEWILGSSHLQQHLDISVFKTTMYLFHSAILIYVVIFINYFLLLVFIADTRCCARTSSIWRKRSVCRKQWDCNPCSARFRCKSRGRSGIWEGFGRDRGWSSFQTWRHAASLKRNTHRRAESHMLNTASYSPPDSGYNVLVRRGMTASRLVMGGESIRVGDE